MAHEFDVVIVGTGPGGYVCAIRASQLGLNVAVVEKSERHGGTCLNVGCIPSKAILHAAEMVREAREDFATLGIKVGGPVEADLDAMRKYRTEAIEANVQGIAFLLKKNKVTVYRGEGRIMGTGRVSVAQKNGETVELKGTNVLIATGSESFSLPCLPVDEKTIVSSTGAFGFDPVPEHLVVVGGGSVGLELGSAWQRLGAEVTVVEALENIIGDFDSEIAKLTQKSLEAHGMRFMLNTQVHDAKIIPEGVELALKTRTGEDAGTLVADKVLVSIGRSPYTEGLGLEEAGVKLNERGFIIVDEQYRTSVEGIYALGDVIGGKMLAHKASDEGVAAAEIFAGMDGRVTYAAIPGVVYTTPEVAGVGKTEDELKAAGVPYKVGKFPFTASGRARTMGCTTGMAKVLACAETERILGAHVVGASAGEIIHEIVVLIEVGGTLDSLTRPCHAHPTLSETLREAALDANKRAIHI